VLFPQPGAEAEHELDALEFVEPVLKRGGQFIGGRRGDADGAGGAELGAGEGAIAIQSAIAGNRAELEVFGQEKGDGDAVAGVDVKLVDEVAVLVAIEEAKLDEVGAKLRRFFAAAGIAGRSRRTRCR
jgi:hypothetical protein